MSAFILFEKSSLELAQIKKLSLSIKVPSGKTFIEYSFPLELLFLSLKPDTLILSFEKF